LENWDSGRIGEQATGASDHRYLAVIHLGADIFRNKPLHVQIGQQELKLCVKRCIFLDRGLGPGQIPRILGHGSKIPDRTIERVKPLF
jgi:hypothetical protein